MSKKRTVPETMVMSSSDETTSGGGTSTHRATLDIMGAEDTRRADLSPIIDAKGQKILAEYSQKVMGNLERQARKGKERLITGRFGQESTKEAIREKLANTAKAPQHALGNVLGLGRLPTPGGPRPR